MLILGCEVLVVCVSGMVWVCLSGGFLLLWRIRVVVIRVV